MNFTLDGSPQDVKNVKQLVEHLNLKVSLLSFIPPSTFLTCFHRIDSNQRTWIDSLELVDKD